MLDLEQYPPSPSAQMSAFKPADSDQFKIGTRRNTSTLLGTTLSAPTAASLRVDLGPYARLRFTQHLREAIAVGMPIAEHPLTQTKRHFAISHRR